MIHVRLDRPEERLAFDIPNTGPCRHRSRQLQDLTGLAETSVLAMQDR